MELETWEHDALDLYYQSRREREKRNLLISIAQKMVGLACIAISIADMVLLEDLTLSTIFVPLGVYLIFTRERVVK